MRPNWRRWIGNGVAALASLLACALLLELVLFRFVLQPDDLLPNVSIDGVVRYVPNTRAVFRHRDGSETLASINEDGWNSAKSSYALRRRPGTLRVAVIGDSYVHAKFVNPHEGFAEVLEHDLRRRGVRAEVFRFGMDGAPLSQYLHVLRKEVRKFKPDIVVVQLIHNDFDESYRFLKTRYASSFMKLATNAFGEVVEIAPADFKPGMADTLRSFASFRYLYYQTGLYIKLKSLISRLYWGGNEDYRPEFISSGVDIRKIADHRKNRFFGRYVLSQMKALAVADGFKLAVAMDGVRDAIYEKIAPQKFEAGRLNIIAAELTSALEIPFLDLHETFAADYAKRRQRFEFSYDWHWNRLANRLAGEAISKMLRTDPRLLKQRQTPIRTSAGLPGRS